MSTLAHHDHELAHPDEQEDATSSPRAERASFDTGLRVLVLALIAAGLSVMLYPSAAAWISQRTQESDVSGYVDTIENLPAVETRAVFNSALDYNARIPLILLSDPYTAGDALADSGGAVETYLDQLTLPGQSTMARIRIPSIDVDLPVFHGTGEDVLARGIGHLFGSSLPVGGPGSHSVLTGHNGFVGAVLFDRLSDVVTGDIFTIDVAGETLYYEVDRIETVLPSDVEDLQIVPGEDYVTLVTCTPTGVNSHRLLVRGTRIAPGEVSETVTNELSGTAGSTGFPWWIVLLAGGILLACALLLLTARRHQPPAPSRPRRADEEAAW